MSIQVVYKNSRFRSQKSEFRSQNVDLQFSLDNDFIHLALS